MNTAVWRAPAWALRRFNQLLVELENEDEESDRAYAIRDEIRSLPNYPHWATEQTTIQVVNTTVR